MKKTSATKKFLLLLIALAVLATACGSDAEANAGEASTPTTPQSSDTGSSDAGSSDVGSSDTGPSAIVSLSPTATEMLFAVGAGDLVVAADEFSNYPPEAPTTDISGYEPNIESILALEPDLIIMSDGAIEPDMTSVGVATLILPAAVTIDDVYTQIEQIGAATGHVGEAAELVGQMQTDIADIVATTPVPETPLTYFHEIDSTLYTATSGTFIGEVYGLFGLENIADPADADGAAFGYPQLTEEFLLDANPDLIFLSDTLYGESAETVGSRPGWDTMTAVQNGNVIELDSDIASRWGPRVAQLVRSISEAITNAAVPA